MVARAIACAGAALGLAAAAYATPVWSRFQIRSVSVPFLQGQPAAPFQFAYVADSLTPEMCVLVIRDASTGHLAAVPAPRQSCEIHGSAQD